MAHKSYGPLLWYLNSALDVLKLENLKFQKGLISINTAWNRATIRVFRIKKKNDIYNYNKKLRQAFSLKLQAFFSHLRLKIDVHELENVLKSMSANIIQNSLTYTVANYIHFFSLFIEK